MAEWATLAFEPTDEAGILRLGTQWVSTEAQRGKVAYIDVTANFNRRLNQHVWPYTISCNLSLGLDCVKAY